METMAEIELDTTEQVHTVNGVDEQKITPTDDNDDDDDDDQKHTASLCYIHNIIS